MLANIIEVKALEGHRLYLKFDDGADGVVDLAQHLCFEGVLRRLEDLAFFQRVRVDPESGTVCWPDEIDLDPQVLHCYLTGVPVEQIEREWAARAKAGQGLPVGAE